MGELNLLEIKSLLIIVTNTNKFENGGLPVVSLSSKNAKNADSLVKKGFLKKGRYVISDEGLGGRSYGDNYLPTSKTKEYLEKISQI